jgi:hypothetical protein
LAEQLVPGSPQWWLSTLEKQLDERTRAVNICENYYTGAHPLPQPNPGSMSAAVEAAKLAWKRLAMSAVTNLTPLIANAASERLEVVGFRFGDATDGDKDAWRMWQAAQLDADSDLVHEAALQTGQAFVLVWPDPKLPSKVSITAEYPDQTIVAYVAGSRRQRAAAMKRWLDDDGYLLATVYLPDGLYKFRSVRKQPTDGSTSMTGDAAFSARWAPREVVGETWPLRNPFGVVPLVEFRANATLKPARFGGGTAEFDAVVPIQDRINKTVFDRLVTAEHQAFRQRYVIGWDFPVDPETQQPNRDAMVQAAASRLWTFENGDGQVQVGELGQADFTGFIKAVESDIQQMAMISRTPPHYLLGQMVNISGDALKASEAALVKKCRRHSRNFGESWEEVMRLALQAIADPRADDQSSMIVWGDVESRTWGETVDAVLKMQALNVPEDALWLMLPDVTPQDVQRWKSMRGAQLVRAVALAPVVAPPTPGGGPGPAPQPPTNGNTPPRPAPVAA